MAKKNTTPENVETAQVEDATPAKRTHKVSEMGLVNLRVAGARRKVAGLVSALEEAQAKLTELEAEQVQIKAKTAQVEAEAALAKAKTLQAKADAEFERAKTLQSV